MDNFWLQPRTLVAYAVSLLALAEIIDLTIVAVAIPQIMGSLGANIDTVAMVTTSYIVAAAVCIPLSGLVVRKYGMRNVMLISSVVFCVSSVLCGMATSLTEMIIFRIFQGIGGAFLPAVAQSYISSHFKNQEQVRMMTLFSLIVVMGPILGPVLGGMLCENLSWRWIFYVNVPICIVAFSIIFIYMQKQSIENIKIDYISFAFMAFGIGCLEYFIDEGNRHGWLSSIFMVSLLTTAVILLGFFIWRGLTHSCVVNLRLFRHSNFVICCIAMFVFMLMVTGALAYFPTMLQQNYGYPVDTAGYLSAPRGITAILVAPFIPRLIRWLGARTVLFLGILIFAISCFMLASFSPNNSERLILYTMIMQGIGMMAFFIPIMQMVFVGIDDEQHSDASGVFNFFRNFAGSVGTSVVATLISHQMQVHYHTLASHVSPYSLGFTDWSSHLANQSTQMQAMITNSEIMGQASLLSYIDAYHFFGIGMLLLLILPLFMKSAKNIQSLNTMH